MPLIFAVSALVFALDQVTKLWIRNSLPPGASFPVIPKIFHLTFITNTGSAFGLFPGGSVFFIFFSILTIGVLLRASYKKRRDFSLLAKVSFGFLIGGISGNLFDRLRFGAVVDFLDFRIWPVFNAADSAITLGVILLSLHLLRKRKVTDASSTL